MEDNKFNKFYYKKSISELIKVLHSHRITGSTLDKEWYEALKIHLSERELDGNSRMVVEKILNTDPETLKKEEETESYRENEIILSNETLSKNNINAAGKSLKKIVTIVIVLILCTILGVLISLISKDFEVIVTSYMFLGIASLICYILILNSLYDAGDYLENA
jgi:hypothetical protein